MQIKEIGKSRDNTQASPKTSKPFEGLRVIVVDDNPDARYLLTLALQEDGAEVIPAASTAEALEAIEKLSPDIIIGDIRIPGEEACALIYKVRELDTEKGRQTPAIAVTGWVREEDRIHALVAGFHKYLCKPIDLDELSSVVANLARRRSLAKFEYKTEKA